MKFTFPFVTTLLSLLPVLVSGQDSDPLACRNCKVDVDDADGRIVYSPADRWTHVTDAPKVQGEQIYTGATYSFATTQGASATFKFTGAVRSFCPAYRLFDGCSCIPLYAGRRIQGTSTIV